MFVYRTVFIRVIGVLGASSDLSLWGYLSDRWPDSDWPSSRWLAVKSVVIVCNRNRIIDRSPFRPNPCTLPASRAPLRCRLIKKSLNRCRNYTGKYIQPISSSPLVSAVESRFSIRIRAYLCIFPQTRRCVLQLRIIFIIGDIRRKKLQK